MKLARPLAISFSLLAFSAASAYAQSSQSTQEKSASQGQPSMSQSGKKEDFSKLDKDADGMLNRMEAAADADAKSRFDKLDENQDQKLSQQEYQGGQSQSAQSQQSQDQSGSTGASASSAQGATKVSQLIGKKVSGKDGKDLGEIKDVVIDMQGAKVHAAVLEFGGTLGMGEKAYAFPISELQQGKEKNELMLNVDTQKLKNAEGFAQGQWPEMDDQYWGRVGGQASAGASKQNMNLVRASKMIGQNVQDKSGQDLGEIKDLNIDLKSGQLSNVVIDVKEAGQASVQPKSLTKGTGDKLVLNMDAKQLKSRARKSGKQDASSGASGSAGSQLSTPTPTTGKTATDPSPSTK